MPIADLALPIASITGFGHRSCAATLLLLPPRPRAAAALDPNDINKLVSIKGDLHSLGLSGAALAFFEMRMRDGAEGSAIILVNDVSTST